MSHEKLLQATVLFGECVPFFGYRTKRLLETKHFLFERFDVQLLALSVRPCSD